MNWRICVLYSYLVILLVSCSDQKLIWSWKLDGRSFGQPLISGETVVIGSQAGEVIAGDVHTGTKRWQVRLGSAVLSSPAVDDRHVFAATEGGHIFCLSLDAGRELWKIATGDSFEAPLMLDQDRLYVPSAGGVIYCVSKSDGKVLWRFEAGKKYSAAVTKGGSHLLIGGWNGMFYCLRPDGEIQWRFQASQRITEPAVVRNNSVFFAAYDGYIYAMDIPTGRLLWRTLAKQPANVVLIENHLVTTSEKDLLTISPQDGGVQKRIPFQNWITRVFVDGRQCIAIARTLQSVDLASGEKSKLIQLQNSIFKVAFLPDMLVVTDDANSVYGFRR